MADPGTARTTTSYMAGVRPPDPTVHAAELGKPDEYLAFCDGKPVAPIGGRFEVDANNACAACRRTVQGQLTSRP
jgi:hypothetical protein